VYRAPTICLGKCELS